jgi:hypothetical protein
VVVLSHPQLRGADLTYDVRRLEGALPEKGGAAALFIDWVAVRPGAAVVVRPVAVRPVAVRPVAVRPHVVVVR